MRKFVGVNRIKLKRYQFWTLLALGVVPLLLMFNWPNARDSAVYANAFSDLINGDNPYSGEVFRSGLLGSLPFYLVSLVFPQSIEGLVFLILGILGTLYFARLFIGRENRISDLFVLLIVLWSSSSREGLNTIQITGILLALNTVVIHAAKQNEPVKFSTTKIFFGSLAAAISIDLKPHLVIPLYILLLHRYRKWHLLSWSLTLWLTGHLIIDITFEKLWTLAWLESMISLASRPTTTNRGDFVNIWSLFATLFGDSSILKILPYLVVALLLLVILRKNIENIATLVFLGTSLSLLMTYTHYYDYVPIVALSMIQVLSARINAVHYCYLGLIMLSQNMNNVTGLVLVMGSMVGLMFMQLTNGPISSLFSEVRRVCAGFIGFIFLHFVMSQLEKLEFDKSAISATIVLGVSFMVFFFYRSEDGTFQTKNNEKD